MHPTGSSVARAPAARERTARIRLGVAAALALATAGVFAQVREFDFLTLDDPLYVSQNPHVRAGLTREGLAWAATGEVAALWHPLTLLSHMLVVELFGAGPGPQHVANLSLHVLNTLLLYAMFLQLTGALWRSAFVAAVLGLHPLHVESVAWISERKDVLSGSFWIASMGSYAAWARGRSGALYALALGLMALGLMAKPMLVTLPFALLLFDVWPLARLPAAEAWVPRRVWPFVREKWPFFALAALGSGISLATQTPWDLAQLSLGQRLGNALVSYARYLGAAFWPTELAIFYPHPLGWPAWQVLGCLLLLLAITGAGIRLRRRAPYLLTGWLFFAGVLVPVIGLVQVGLQARADRYTYIPLIGLSWAVAWGACDLAGRGRRGRLALAVAAGVAVAALAFTSFRYASRWQDSSSLARHALAVTRDNYVAHAELALARFEAGDLDGALAHLQEAIRIEPRYAHAHAFLAAVRLERGELAQALEAGTLAIRLDPSAWKPREVVAEVFERRGELAPAEQHYRAALERNPLSSRTRNRLARTLARAGRLAEAEAGFRESIRLDPADPDAREGLALALAQQGRLPAALEALERMEGLPSARAAERARAARSRLHSLPTPAPD